MALMGLGYWALVGGLLSRVIIILVLTYLSCPWTPGRMRKGTGVRDMLKFGAHLTTGHILSYLARNLDKVLIGKLIGAVPLGLYTKANDLLLQPLNQIRYPLTSMSLPVLSSLKKDPERYVSYFDKLLDISISVALPISVYAFLDSEFLIRLVLGPQWTEAAPVFRILAIGGIFVSASFLPGVAMLSHGFSKRYMQLTIATSVITSVSFIVGVYFGIKGVATAYTLASFLVLIPMYLVSFRGTPIKSRMVFETILWPLLSAAIAAGAAFVFIRFYSGHFLVTHIGIALIFFVLYTSLTLVRKKTRQTILSIWKGMISRKKND